MQQGSKTHLVPDRELGIEYYRFEGFMRPFARHFHPHYVFGLVEEGTRTMQCRGAVHELGREHVLLLNPGDYHGCDCGDVSLTYASLAIPADVMKSWTGASSASLPVFAPNVLRDADLSCCMRILFTAMECGEESLRKKELFGYLVCMAVDRYAGMCPKGDVAGREEIEWACRYLEEHFREHVLLDDLCAGARVSKSTLLRGFLRTRGVTPHQYLANIRVDAARKLLQCGVSPTDVAGLTGFSDQSHFTRAFAAFTGIPPGLYRDMFAASHSIVSKRTREQRS